MVTDDLTSQPIPQITEQETIPETIVPEQTAPMRCHLQAITPAGILTLTCDSVILNAIFESSQHAWPDAPAELFKFAAQVKQLTTIGKV